MKLKLVRPPKAAIGSGHGRGSAARPSLHKIDDLQHVANPALDLGTIAAARNLENLSSTVVSISQLGTFALLECGEVEPFGISALLAFDQSQPDGLGLEAALLFAPDQIADHFIVIGVKISSDLCRNPSVLLLGQCDGLAHRCHCSLHAASLQADRLTMGSISATWGQFARLC